MNKILYLCIAVCLYAMPMYAENKKCEECVKELSDSNVVCRIGYGYSTKKKEAEAQARNKAKDALLEVLRDSVAKICYRVEVQRDKKEEYLKIKYFRNKDITTKFYFHEEGVLNNIQIHCQECVRKKDGEYEASCVMSAPTKEFSRASDVVMFQILSIMSEDLF